MNIDGVPVLHGPTNGPARAGLLFRVGMADEPLSRRGITHLIEHLALHAFGRDSYHYNGTTGVEHTHFFVQGTPDELVTFVNGVCAALHDLPMSRVPVEKEILRAEEQGESRGATGDLPMWRHGARGHGVVSYPEWGLPALTENDLREWVARYFTRDNAVLWIAGDHIPAGFRLALPGGARMPLPPVHSALPATPAWFPGAGPAVAWTGVVPRGEPAAVLAGLLEREMFRALRQDGGLSYTASARLRDLGADLALITAVADTLPEKQNALLGGFVDVLARIRLGQFTPQDLGTVVAQRRDFLRHAAGQGDLLFVGALDLLAGRASPPLDAVLSVTAAEVIAAARTACASGLLMAPDGTHADWAGFTPAPARSESAVHGHAHPALGRPDISLIVAGEGVTRTAPEGLATVRFDDCAVVRAWPDGARLLIGNDAIVVAVEPTLFRDGQKAVAAMDARTPPGVRVDQPARDPAGIPGPPMRQKRKIDWRARRPLWLALVVGALVGSLWRAIGGPNATILTLLTITMVMLATTLIRIRRAAPR